jgi:hypothetical protein
MTRHQSSLGSSGRCRHFSRSFLVGPSDAKVDFAASPTVPPTASVCLARTAYPPRSPAPDTDERPHKTAPDRCHKESGGRGRRSKVRLRASPTPRSRLPPEPQHAAMPPKVAAGRLDLLASSIVCQLQNDHRTIVCIIARQSLTRPWRLSFRQGSSPRATIVLPVRPNPLAVPICRSAGAYPVLAWAGRVLLLLIGPWAAPKKWRGGSRTLAHEVTTSSLRVTADKTGALPAGRWSTLAAPD